jgi:RNA-directed DNA polymerase
VDIAIKSQTTANVLSLSYLEQLLKIDRTELRQLANTSGKFYKPFDLHKEGSDKWRHIDNPQHPLKSLQKKILKNILEKNIDQLPQGMNGGISGRSIVDNAKLHIGKECIGIIDIKDCFPSTDNLQIYRVWLDYFGCGTKNAKLLTKLTTFQRRLPQGAPTSPLLCNFTLASMFKTINTYTQGHNLNASIFIDDITISGNKKDVEKAVEYIVKILIQSKYSVRKRKVRVITSGYQQKVTGVTVNSKASINRHQIESIRNLIIETASLKGYLPSHLYNKLQGHISFAKSVSKQQGKKLEEFAESQLIKPIVQTDTKKQDQIRTCKRFSRDHSYQSE